MKTKWAVMIGQVIFLMLVQQVNASPILSIDRVDEALQGNVATLKLKLADGSEAYAGTNVKIWLPAGVRVTNVTKGNLLSAGDFVIDYQTSSAAGGSWLIVLAYSGTDAITKPTGVLLELDVKITTAAPIGMSAILFAESDTNPRVNTKHALSNLDGTQSVLHNYQHSRIRVITETSDNDGDGIPDISDKDDDNDGMTDSWETLYGFDPVDESDAHLDVDGDGFTNLAERKAGTDPWDPDSRPPLVQPRKSPLVMLAPALLDFLDESKGLGQ